MIILSICRTPHILVLSKYRNLIFKTVSLLIFHSIDSDSSCDFSLSLLSNSHTCTTAVYRYSHFNVLTTTNMVILHKVLRSRSQDCTSDRLLAGVKRSTKIIDNIKQKKSSNFSSVNLTQSF